MNPRFVFIADTHHFSRTLSDGGAKLSDISEVMPLRLKFKRIHNNIEAIKIVVPAFRR